MYYGENELYHYGVKGMKWGVRKRQYESEARKANREWERSADERDRAKKVYKQAKKDYNKAFNKAQGRALAGFSPSKKHRDADKERWNDAINKGKAMEAAKADYKAKKRAELTKRKDSLRVDRVLRQCEKMEKKEFVERRSAEINAGASFARKLYNTITDDHRYKAIYEYHHLSPSERNNL